MVPAIKLNSGSDMPQVGFGLWKVDPSIASDVVYNAIKAGYRLFDGACGTSKSSHHPLSTRYLSSRGPSLVEFLFQRRE